MPAEQNAHVQEVIRSAHEELRGLLKQRSEIVKRISTVKGTVWRLAEMFGPTVLKEDLRELLEPRVIKRQTGFTKSCRNVLMEAGRPLRAHEVCERLQNHPGATLSHHKAPLASVSTVLNRLEHYGEVRALTDREGRRQWEWIGHRNRRSDNTNNPKENNAS